MNKINGFHYNYDHGVFGIFAYEDILYSFIYEGMLDCEYLDTPTIKKAAYEAQQYLEGKLQKFSVNFLLYHINQPLIEKMILEEVMKIPYGKIITYSDFSIKLDGKITEDELEKFLIKSRLPFFIPTHRVVRSNKDYGDFELGPKMKKTLIEMEANYSKTK